ncbi:MAG TPA: helicase-exonuclease AddAB subunit AddA [Humisphaera sp.]
MSGNPGDAIHRADEPPPPPAKPGLTPDQRRGVETVGRTILMSAAAGSGKTRVLAERCAYLVCDAPPGVRCDVDELLVVTFTEAAAAEMRDRIGKALAARLASSPAGVDAGRLEHQLALVDQAQISTLHAFCARLLRQHFHLVPGLDPAFVVMDEHEAMLLRLDVGRELFRRRYAEDKDHRFHKLLDLYAEGDDERLLGEVLRLHDLLGSMIDPDEWAGESLERIEGAAGGELIKSDLGRALVESVRRRITAVGQLCNEKLKLLETFGAKEFDQYRKRVTEIRDTCRHLYSVIATSGLGAVAEEAAVQFDNLKPVKSTVPDKDAAKAAVDAVMKEYKEGGWRQLLRFSEAQWQEGLTMLAPHVRELLDLVRAFGEAYAREKQEARQLDFADLERFALHVLLDRNQPGQAPSATGRYYQRQFRHVLVDEYQDINAVQSRILDLVSRNGADPSLPANRFFVGDVKQSIYRFRLADPEQFLRLQKQLRSDKTGRGEVIDLKQNFRSRGPLLEAINAVFARLMTESAAEIRYDDTQRLVPGRSFPDAAGRAVFPGAPIELHLLAGKASEADGEAAEADDDGDAGWDRTEREAAFVAKRIRQIVGADGGTPVHVFDRGEGPPRPASYRDIVILLRSKRYKANQFVRILELFDVPTHADSGSGFFESTEVRDVVALLCLLDNQRQDLELAAYLRSPLARLANAEDAMATVRIAYRSERGKPVPFHEAVVRYAAERSDPLALRLKSLLDALHELRLRANRQPVHDTIWQVYQETGYLAYVNGLHNGRQRAANLLELYDRARGFATHRRQGLGRFLDFLKTLEAEADLGQPSVASEAQDVVRIMTVHASKGLEFPIVFLPDCGKRINTRDETGPILTDRQLGIGMPVADERLQVRYPSLAEALVKERVHRKLMAEELRVLYVALTRAMEHLILVGTADADAPQKWQAGYSGRVGPLPEQAIVGARTVLDWLGPVWAAEFFAGGNCLDLKVHSLAELEADRPGRRRAELSERLRRLCDRKPIEPAPPLGEQTRRVVDRLEYVYPHEQETGEPAVKSVTALAKSDREVTYRVPTLGEEPGKPKGAVGSLALPVFAAPARPLAATEVGTAVHLLLQHLRFAEVKSAADVRRQADELVAALKLPAELRPSLDDGAIDDVAWFVTKTEVGKLVAEHEPRLMREMPVLFRDPTAPDSVAPHDATMIRGRLDLFVPLAGGGVIVDYKTDRVETVEQVQDRMVAYRQQVGLYADAVALATGRAVSRTYLVFLYARRVEVVET